MPIKKYRKAKSRIIKIEKSGFSANVALNKNNTSFLLNKHGKLILNYKIKCEKSDNSNYKLGDKILSFDSSQTSAYAYAILEIVNSETPNSFQAKNLDNNWVLVLKTGDVTSYTSLKDRAVIDQLSYNGVNKDANIFKDWTEGCRNFIKPFNNESIFKEYCKIEGKCDNLYYFNMQYPKFIRKIMKGKDFNMDAVEYSAR